MWCPTKIFHNSLVFFASGGVAPPDQSPLRCVVAPCQPRKIRRELQNIFVGHHTRLRSIHRTSTIPAATLEIIPVFDIKAGVAVHALRGDRANYQPLISRFPGAPDVTTLTANLLGELPVSQLYIADLDALSGNSSNTQLILRLAASYPEVRFLIDAGFSPNAPPEPFVDIANIDVVIATESLRSVADYDDLRARIPDSRQVLSLDCRGSQRLGCETLFEDPTLWPARVIHMNLALVGADTGPDLQGLQALRARTSRSRILAAGGVRSAGDLQRLADSGIDGALVATALHDGRLTGSGLTTARCPPAL